MPLRPNHPNVSLNSKLWWHLVGFMNMLISLKMCFVFGNTIENLCSSSICGILMAVFYFFLPSFLPLPDNIPTPNLLICIGSELSIY